MCTSVSFGKVFDNLDAVSSNNLLKASNTTLRGKNLQIHSDHNSLRQEYNVNVLRHQESPPATFLPETAIMTQFYRAAIESILTFSIIV